MVKFYIISQTITVMCAVNAAGTYLPPMMIFKRKRMSELLLKGTPHGTIGGVSENGWIESELFVKWLEHFVHHIQPSEYRCQMYGGTQLHTVIPKSKRHSEVSECVVS